MNTRTNPFHPYCLLLIFSAFSFTTSAQQPPLLHAYAHNDYWHKHPLYDALDNGFTYVEADVWVRNGQLLVSHKPPLLGKYPTLDKLYLQPLDSLFSTNGKSETAAPPDNVVLMIDIKSRSKRAYQLLKELMAAHQHMLTVYKDGLITYHRLTVILTGKYPKDLIGKETTRYMFADGPIEKLTNSAPGSGLYLTASGRYSNIVTWTGKNYMNDEEKDRLKNLVAKAHAGGQKVRLWASPENEAVWMQLLNCGVDLINTDKLESLRRFLTADVSSR